MIKRKTKKDKTYICVICGKKKKASRQIKCCSKNMVSKNKGSWNL